MHPPPRSSRGYSLVELLVVLAILAVLAAVGVTMVGDRASTSVRSMVDDIEGTLASAHKFTVASGADVLVATHGDWAVSNPFVLAYGNAALGTSVVLTNGRNASESFRIGLTSSGIQPDHQRAAVVTNATADWWTTAASASGMQAITDVPPFNDSATGFQGILATATYNLCQGGSNDNSIRISGSSKRFTTTFWIQMVSIQNGSPVPGGPMGLIVGLANGATIYKFYNPGVLNGAKGKWRRI